MPLEETLHFKDNSLSLGYWARFWTRIIKGIFSIVLGALLVTLLLSDIQPLFYLGLVLAVLWIYKIIRSRLDQSVALKKGNLAKYATYRTRKIIESAHDKSAVLGGGILLNVIRELSDIYQIESLLHQLGVDRNEFISKTEHLLKEEIGIKETAQWRQDRIEELMIKAFITQKDKHEPIAPIHLFRGAVEVENERLKRLFGIFGIEPGSIDRVIQYGQDK